MKEVPFDLQVVEDIAVSFSRDVNGAGSYRIRLVDKHSNRLAEVRFGNGRTLMVKQARYAEMAVRFNTSREASRLLRDVAGVLAPEYLELEPGVSPAPILVYWRIPNPSLYEIKSKLDASAFQEAMRSWGRLMRRIHEVRIPGSGPLLQAEATDDAPAVFLRRDLEERLIPHAAYVWPSGERAGERLLGMIDEVDRRTGSSVLLHNDLFAPNVLCTCEDGRAECVGVLDLEDAFAGPPEAELAKTEILHGPLFGRYWKGAWFNPILEGYGDAPDAVLMAFFRAYHMMNMGYHAASVGMKDHAEDVAVAMLKEVDAASSGRRHEDVIRGSEGRA